MFKGLTAQRLYKSFGVKGLNIGGAIPPPHHCYGVHINITDRESAGIP
jgi:hypothetical protein